MLQTNIKEKLIIFLAQNIIAISNQKKKISYLHEHKKTDPATKMNYLYAQKNYLPRPIEDATPRATHHSPNRKYLEISSTCCRNIA